MIRFPFRVSVSAVCAACLLATACGRSHPKLIVGSKDGTEQLLLGEILAQHLSAKLPDDQIERRFGLGNAVAAHSSLLTGEVSIYPEYSGTALFNVLKIEPDRGDDPLLDQVREGYRNTFRCEWFGPLGYSSARVFLIPRRIAEKRNIRNLSEAGKNQEGWAIGGNREFRDRPDGMVLLTRKYEFQLSAPAQILSEDQLYTSLSKDLISFGVTRNTDPHLGSGDLVQLADDQSVYPAYEAGYVVKLETLEANPGLANAVKGLYGKITLERMRAMVRRVDSDKLPADKVAGDFLKEVGLN
ncbi:MAG: glycine betaine ABC transporter substrate-binding protein [Paludibaculum sp.]